MNENLLNLFHNSFQDFLNQNTNNILNGVAERNLCARLGFNFEMNFKKYGINGYYADPEYNRKQGGQVKTIIDNETEIIVIQCDLIIHSRGEIISNDNLITIEMKKSNRPNNEKIADRKRLRAMTKDKYDDIWSNDGMTLPEHVCCYEIGIYLLLNIRKRTFDVEYYYKGNKVNDEIISF